MRVALTVVIALAAGFVGGAVGGIVAPGFFSGRSSAPPPSEELPPAEEVPATAPAKETGVLHLDTVPWSVVFLDGEELGDTPLRGLRLPPGVHEFRFLPERKRPEIFREVEVKAGQTARVKLTLKNFQISAPAPSPAEPPPPPDAPSPR